MIYSAHRALPLLGCRDRSGPRSEEPLYWPVPVTHKNKSGRIMNRLAERLADSAPIEEDWRSSKPSQANKSPQRQTLTSGAKKDTLENVKVWYYFLQVDEMLENSRH